MFKHGAYSYRLDTPIYSMIRTTENSNAKTYISCWKAPNVRSKVATHKTIEHTHTLTLKLKYEKSLNQTVKYLMNDIR
jgi:hypothetical protein